MRKTRNFDVSRSTISGISQENDYCWGNPACGKASLINPHQGRDAITRYFRTTGLPNKGRQKCKAVTRANRGERPRSPSMTDAALETEARRRFNSTMFWVAANTGKLPVQRHCCDVQKRAALKSRLQRAFELQNIYACAVSKRVCAEPLTIRLCVV